AAGRAVPEQHVPALVLRDGAHPTIRGVRLEGGLLEHGRRPARVADLVPAHARDAAGGDGMVRDQRLVVPEVPVGEAVHHAVGQRVELLGRARLRHAGAAAAGGSEGGDRDAGGAGQRGVGRRGPVDVVPPEAERVVVGVVEGHNVVGRARGRGGGPVQVGRQQAAAGGGELGALLGGGRAAQHGGAVHGADVGAAGGGAG